MSVVSRLNTEFDSRILRTSIGSGGATKPLITRNGQLERVSCLNCGKPGGAFTAGVPASLRNDPGFIYICDECHARVGALPLPAISFANRRES